MCCISISLLLFLFLCRCLKTVAHFFARGDKKTHEIRNVLHVRLLRFYSAFAAASPLTRLRAANFKLKLTKLEFEFPIRPFFSPARNLSATRCCCYGCGCSSASFALRVALQPNAARLLLLLLLLLRQLPHKRIRLSRLRALCAVVVVVVCLHPQAHSALAHCYAPRVLLC